jgi:peptidoglycan/LPS O-acetylase OafA/YrhL
MMVAEKPATAQSPVSSYKLIHLETVRGLASVIVLVHHFCLAFWARPKLNFPRGLGQTPLYWLLNGSAAVYLFFLLSGFVLTRRYFDRGASRGELAVATAKRLPRLIVPAGASILLAWAVLRLGWSEHVAAGQVLNSRWLSSFANAGFPPDYVPSFAIALQQCVTVFFHDGFDGLLNSNLWTMFPELFGSFLCFALVWLAMAARLRSVAEVVLAAVICVGLAMALGHYALPFAIGTLLARFLPYERMQVTPRLGAIGCIVGLALCSSRYFLLETLGALAIIKTVLICPPIARSLSGRWGAFLGRYSFPIYLVHPIILCSAASSLYLAVLDASGSRIAALALAFGATLILTFLVAMPFVALESWWVPTLNRWTKRLLPVKSAVRV